MRTSNWIAMTLAALCWTAVAVSAATALSRPVLRVLLVACTDYVNPNWNGISVSCIEDRRKLDGLVNGLIADRREAWGVAIDVVDLYGRQATFERFWTEFRALAGRTQANDTLMVYFTGHGVMDRDSGGHRLLAVDDRFIDRDDLARQMAGLECRLKILLTDCCSSFQSLTRARGIGGPGGPEHDYRKLFFGHRGFTNVTGASAGQSSYGDDDGGWFTNHLLFPTDRAFSTWMSAFQHARERVRVKSQSEGQRVQIPLAHSLAVPDEEGPAAAPPAASTYRVRKVPVGQHLNVRREPIRPKGDDNIVDQIPHDGRGLTMLESPRGEWVRIRYRHPNGYAVEGWVNLGFIEPE